MEILLRGCPWVYNSFGHAGGKRETGADGRIRERTAGSQETDG